MVQLNMDVPLPYFVGVIQPSFEKNLNPSIFYSWLNKYTVCMLQVTLFNAHGRHL